MNATTYRPDMWALFQLRRSSEHRRAICGNYALFADRKQQWIAQNPDATSEEYDRAIHGISRECGV